MSRRVSSLVLSVVLGLSVPACNSDDLFGVDPSTSTGETTGTSTGTTAAPTSTGIDPTSTGDVSSSSTGEPPPETTCDEFLGCLGPCALSADIECIIGCTEGLPPDEAAKVGQLVVCLGMACFESGACTPETLQEPLCLACIAFGLMNPNPPGCEAEADACYP